MNSQFIKCPCCSSENTFLPFIINPCIDTKSISSDLVFHISKCSNCGFVTQYPKKNKDVYTKLGYHTQENYEEHCINRAQYIFDFLGLNRIINTTTLRILDLGSGRGGVGYFLKNEIEKLGVSASVEGVTLQKEENTYINTLYLDIDEPSDLVQIVFNKKYDLIIMSHSLEHLLYPGQILSIIDKYLLNTGGLVYIEVPSLYTTKVRTKNQFISQHISYFTKKSLTNLIHNNSRLNIVKMKQSNYWGNIKCLLVKHALSDNLEYTKETFVNTKYYLSQIKNTFYRFITKFKTIGNND
mgnify:CR=1 FL=1